MAQKQVEQETQQSGRGKMTVEEAGRLGGHKGGQRVKQLIEEGKRAERKDGGEEIEDTEEEEDGEA